MSTQKFQIPSEFQSELRCVESQDTRSDAEILAELNTRVPVQSEKNIWTYWHAGINAMPSWCQRNIINWVRLSGPSWKIRVLDTVPDSPNHALTWIDPNQLPATFVKGTMTGPYVGPHSADFLRGAALYAYGGVWSDVSIILFRDLDRACWDQLADENSPYTVSTPWIFQDYMANFFVAARKGDEFIKRWHELFIHFWKGRDDFHGIVESPLISFVKHMSFDQLVERGFGFKWKVDELTALGYVGQILAWVRLCWLKEPNGGFDGIEYYKNKVLLFDVIEEGFAAETVVGWEGKELFSALTTRLDADPESEEYQKAYACIWKLLTKSTMQKIAHAKELMQDLACGSLLDLPENQGKDCAPGTFAELMRWGSVHLEQTRKSIAYVKPIGPKPEFIIHEPLLGFEEP